MFVVMMIMVMMLVIGNNMNGKDGDVDLDDLYIMMKSLCVCHEKWALSTSELSALPAGRLWPSDHDDKDDRDDNEDDAW